MTLACAACLTVGMGAVACADTVDLGYGLHAATSNGVKASVVDSVSTNPNLRTKEQNAMMNEVNALAAKRLGEYLNEVYKVEVPPFQGKIADGYNLYQLSGDSALGHHTAWLVNYNINKDIINYAGDAATKIVNNMIDKKEEKLPDSKPYSKSSAEDFITNMKPISLDKNALKPVMERYNTRLNSDMNTQLNLMTVESKKLSPKEQQAVQEVVDVLKQIIPNFSVQGTDFSATSYTSKFGVMQGVSMRGSLNYDGFKLPGSLELYTLPQDEGLTIQLLATEDTSHDYWTKQLESMYGLKVLKGGNK
jgi:putative glutamyl-tRNA(gln) amidotransferase subunit A